MAILELVVNGKYFDQLIVNRFHYVGSGTPAAVTHSFALCYATGYLASRLTSLVFASGTLAKNHQARVSSSYQFISSYARNLYSVTDFYESPFPATPVGEDGGTAMSPFISYGFRSNRVRTDIRRGMKRFAGVSEAVVDAGGVIASGTVTALQAWADVMSDVLTYDDEGNTLSYSPVVLGLDSYTTESGATAYRPYSTQSVQETHLAQGIAWQPYTNVRSQVSRQYGRGA